MTLPALRPTSHRAILIAALGLAFALRAAALDTYGFSEDETAKLRAIEAYRNGSFSTNAEHPMLMKLAMWGSLSAGELAARTGLPISPETALRLPNVLAGTATVAFAAGVATLLFSPLAGMATAVLVASDPNVIAVNRLGKEDTFLLLFFFVAVWCYERAKRIGEHDLERAWRWYTAAGAAFGLMLASKYMPHLLGLYALFNVIYLKDAGANAPRRREYYGAMAGTFVAVNFAILLPSTWRYCLAYLRGEHLTHHGFYYDGTLYVTDSPVPLSGVPVTYYLEMLWTKVPLPVLAAALVGLVPLVTRRRERGFVWMRVLLFFQLFGYSLAAAKFQRYGLSILLLVDMLAAVGVATIIEWGWRHWRAQPGLRWATVAAAITAVASPLAASLSVRPFYSINQNALGAWLAPPARTFPEEAYDYGVREAVREIARHAGSRAEIISDAPGVVAHYVSRSGRPDLRVVSLSQAGIRGEGERWVIVQDGHIYFENASSVAQLRHTQRAWREFRMGATPVLELYHLPERAMNRPATGRHVSPRTGAAGSS